MNRYWGLGLLGWLLAFSGKGQSLQGRWYMINRSGLIESTFTRDSVASSQLFFDMMPKQGRQSSTAYVQQVALPGRQLLVLRSEKGYAALTYFDVQPGRQMRQAWNGLDTVVANLETLLALHRRDTRRLYGYVLYHADQLPVLRSVPNIDSMPLPVFLQVVRHWQSAWNEIMPTFAKYNVGYAAATHNNQLFTQAIAANGYNPLCSVIDIDNLFKKYMDHPEVKRLLPKER